MAATDDILNLLPIDQLAAELGATPAQTQQAAAAAIPALLGGLQANADDGGAGSILEALGQHPADLVSGTVDLGSVDTGDGAKIASHIFGGNEDQVYNALGSSGAGLGSSLIKKLIPILAPIVLSYITKQILGKASSAGGGAQSSSGGGGLGDILGSILGGGGLGGSTAPAPSSGGGGGLQDILNDVLGQATGSATTTSSASSGQDEQGGSGNVISDILGGLLGGGTR